MEALLSLLCLAGICYIFGSVFIILNQVKDEFKDRVLVAFQLLMENTADQLIESGIFCNVLNAKNDEMEAELIAQAGAIGAVTVSTNMAGRGVDIVLGGLPANPQEYAKVADPGSSRFFISLEDDLLSRYGILNHIPHKYALLKQDEALKDSIVFETIEHTQRVVDGQNFEIRKNLSKYADLLEQQRRIMYDQRQNLLLEITQPELLASQENDLYRMLCGRLGYIKVKQLERYVTLLKIDQCWADYLDFVNYIKEGIHLESISNRNPVDEFHRQIVQAFDKLSVKIEQEILSAFESLDWTKEDIDLEPEGLKRPSATWTYIINDSFFQKRVSLF